jgi:hypothetical protein
MVKNNQTWQKAVNTKQHGDKWISPSCIYFLNRFVNNNTLHILKKTIISLKDAKKIII